jgi:hypothetical protein
MESRGSYHVYESLPPVASKSQMKLVQWFSTYGSRPKIGSRETSVWVANIFSKSLFFILDEPLLANAKVCGKENNIEISLIMRSLLGTYFTSLWN